MTRFFLVIHLFRFIDGFKWSCISWKCCFKSVLLYLQFITIGISSFLNEHFSISSFIWSHRYFQSIFNTFVHFLTCYFAFLRVTNKNFTRIANLLRDKVLATTTEFGWNRGTGYRTLSKPSNRLTSAVHLLLGAPRDEKALLLGFVWST